MISVSVSSQPKKSHVAWFLVTRFLHLNEKSEEILQSTGQRRFLRPILFGPQSSDRHRTGSSETRIRM